MRGVRQGNAEKTAGKPRALREQSGRKASRGRQSKFFSAVPAWLQQRYQAWIDHRLPPQREITLDQRRVFIFPSRQGLVFLLVLLIMLLAAINYENNMIFALVFLLLSVFVVGILHTFANLAGLTLRAVRAQPAFVGDSVEFEVQVSRQGRRDYYDVQLTLPDGESQTVSLVDASDVSVALHLRAEQRGWLEPGRLRVETFYPLGWLRCWTLLAMDMRALVYPRPLRCTFVGSGVSDSEDGDVQPIPGSDDFYEFRAYQAGDSLRHVFWKNYAKGQPLQTKRFAAYRERQLWLDWQDFTGHIETRLSGICYWALQLEKQGECYGLRLPAIEIAPGQGAAHLQRVLRALALFKAPSLS